MKVKTAAWQQGIADNIYRSRQQNGKDPENKENIETQTDTDKKEGSSEAAQGSFSAIPTQSSSASGSDSNKIKSSVPDDNIGQLASELANCRTKFDVQQVSGKAMRAMASLRMSSALSEGKDKEKIAQMIRRMQKLTKRIRTKMKNLTKEEELEKRQKRAEEEKKEQEARNLQNELRNKRNKRQRDERNYALKEAAQGNRDTAAGNILPGANTGTPSLPSGGSAPMTAQAAVSIDAGAALAMESVSLDVTV